MVLARHLALLQQLIVPVQGWMEGLQEEERDTSSPGALIPPCSRVEGRAGCGV